MAKILIVDDSETLRNQLVQELEQDNHITIEAYDGQNGIDVLNQNPDIELIFCDVNMPIMDGLTMCEKIHADDRFNKIPIFMLTTESSPEMKARGKMVGVTAWVTKPFNPAKVLAGIKMVLNK